MSASPSSTGAPGDARFEADRLRRALGPFSESGAPPASDYLGAYLDYYRIDLAAAFPGVSHRIGTFESGGETLVAQSFEPVDAAGTAVVLHGYYDHAGLYGHLFRYCLGRRLAVLVFDQPGHGLSSGVPAVVGSFDEYVAALDACLDIAAALPRPLSLMAQSMGGAVAMEWLMARGGRAADSPFANVVLLAPLVRPAGWAINRIVYRVARLLISERKRVFAVNSEDAEFLAFLKRDPLQARVLPVAWVTAMVEWMTRFERYPASDIAPLVVQGQRDGTVDWRYNLAVIRRLFRPIECIIPEARHHLVNDSPAVRDTMFAFLDRELKTEPGS